MAEGLLSLHQTVLCDVLKKEGKKRIISKEEPVAREANHFLC